MVSKCPVGRKWISAPCRSTGRAVLSRTISSTSTGSALSTSTMIPRPGARRSTWQVTPPSLDDLISHFHSPGTGASISIPTRCPAATGATSAPLGLRCAGVPVSMFSMNPGTLISNGVLRIPIFSLYLRIQIVARYSCGAVAMTLMGT